LTDLATNLATAERLMDQAAAEGAQLVSLPEYFVQMGLSETDKFHIAEALGQGPIQAMLSAKARQHAMWVAGGSIPIQTLDPAKVTNTALLFNPQGERVARYDKLHLFSYQDGTRHLDEGRTMVAGTSVVVAETPFGRVGLSICYDLRFPELYRAMGKVDLILVPSAFTVPTGTAHWHVLLRARAIENQCYLLAVGQGGRHDVGQIRPRRRNLAAGVGYHGQVRHGQVATRDERCDCRRLSTASVRPDERHQYLLVTSGNHATPAECSAVPSA
jgi:nitrilase